MATVVIDDNGCVGNPTVFKHLKESDKMALYIANNKHFDERYLKTGKPSVGWTTDSETNEVSCIGIHGRKNHLGVSKNKFTMQTKGFLAANRLAKILAARKSAASAAL